MWFLYNGFACLKYMHLFTNKINYIYYIMNDEEELNGLEFYDF